MLLFKICLLGSLILLCTAESLDSLTKDKDEPSPVTVDENTFETAHKIHRPDEEFHTSHKITNLPKAQYLKAQNEDEDTARSLMQLQQTQNLLSTKERPELNPILSALINEDVMKSIEAKRAIEQELLDAVSAEATSATTEGQTLVLTTAKTPTADASLEDELNIGLIDQPINLDAAGSENNQKSRIQIKKGPNGMDYEYEYVYYYYDDDEATAGGKKQQEAESAVVEETSKKGSAPQERGKSRYTNIERSTTSAPDNVLVSGKAKGRANTPAASEDVDEGRLPAITRFPSRGKTIEVQPTASLEGLENTASASNEKSKKISVKRPSLELVDSETFNTDEKQVKGSPRNGDSEKPTPVAVSDSPKSSEEVEEVKNEEDDTEEEALVADEVDQTTPLMEKAALDLYAILANENLEMDMTTDLDNDLTTDLPDTTESDEDGLTTIQNEAETVIPTTPSTTTTTTTTEAPTTTTTTSTTTTTTTTTPAPSLFGAGRRGIATAGRNRFRLKSGASTGTTTTTTETPTAAAAAAEPESSGGLKGRNRFQRPSFGNRNRAAASAAPPSAAPVEEEVIAKEEEKTVASSPVLRGRTRNRFNIRGQASTTTTTAEPSQEQEQSDEENQVSSTTARSLRGRPTLNLRGRSRIGSRPTASTQAPITAEEDDAAPVEPTEDKQSSLSLPTRPSRFNLNRVGAAPGGNRLLPRGRLNTLRTTPTTPPAAESTDDSNNDVKDESDDRDTKSESETTTAAAAGGGLNKLKTRPRLNLQSKTDNKPKASPIPARKVNPLLARRKLALGPSTTEAAVAPEEPSEESSDNTSSDDIDKKEGDSNQTATDEAAPEDNTEVPETTTKQAHGLGLLAQRRRLPIRKPGTLL